MFKPLHDKVLLRRAKAEEKIGSIFIPDRAKERPRHATVVAVGPGVYDEDGQRVPIPASPGDKVLIDKWAGHPLGHLVDEGLVLVSTLFEDDDGRLTGFLEGLNKFRSRNYDGSRFFLGTIENGREFAGFSEAFRRHLCVPLFSR